MWIRISSVCVWISRDCLNLFCSINRFHLWAMPHFDLLQFCKPQYFLGGFSLNGRKKLKKDATINNLQKKSQMRQGCLMSWEEMGTLNRSIPPAAQTALADPQHDADRLIYCTPYKQCYQCNIMENLAFDWFGSPIRARPSRAPFSTHATSFEYLLAGMICQRPCRDDLSASRSTASVPTTLSCLTLLLPWRRRTLNTVYGCTII